MTRPRVLLADDHRLLREAFARLSEAECDVVGAVVDGRQLLDAAPVSRPDIGLLDVAMPLLNGIDAARQLKQRLPRIKIIFLTVSAEPDVAAEAFRVGGVRLPAQGLRGGRGAPGHPRGVSRANVHHPTLRPTSGHRVPGRLALRRQGRGAEFD